MTRHTRRFSVNVVTERTVHMYQPQSRPPRLNLWRFLRLAEMQKMIVADLDQRDIVALRLTQKKVRNLVPAPSCRNRRLRPRYFCRGHTDRLTNLNPWTEPSWPYPRIQCDRDGSTPRPGTDPKVMRRCQGQRLFDRGVIKRPPRHAAQFWVCRRCVFAADCDFNYTISSPYFQGLCFPCSMAAHINSTGTLCLSKVFTGINTTNDDCWLCADCAINRGEAEYLAMVNGIRTTNLIPVLDIARPDTDVRRWVRHGPQGRNFCRSGCGRSWAQILQTYPPDNTTWSGRDLRWMFKRCLYCDQYAIYDMNAPLP